MTDPQLRQEVATAVGRHLRANPPGDSCVDDVEAVFAGAIMYVCMVITYSKGKDQPSKVANPARGQLNRDK